MSAASSAHFIVSAVIVHDGLDAQARAELAVLRGQLGRHPGQVVHFRKLTHQQKIKAAQDIAASSIAAITNVIICKRQLAGIPSPTGPAAQPYISKPDPMYLWAMRLLLERVSWYVRDHGGESSIVTVAHTQNFQAQKLHNYRQALSLSPTSIHWASFDGHPFRFAGTSAIELLQIADGTASALFAAIEPDQFGNVETRYLADLAAKLYRYGGSPITSYGLKVFPSSQANLGGPLHHLRQF